MRTHRVSYLVDFNVPIQASETEIREYIETAIRSERGYKHPDDPMFHAASGAVTVKNAERVLSAYRHMVKE